MQGDAEQEGRGRALESHVRVSVTFASLASPPRRTQSRSSIYNSTLRFNRNARTTGGARLDRTIATDSTIALTCERFAFALATPDPRAVTTHVVVAARVDSPRAPAPRSTIADAPKRARDANGAPRATALDARRRTEGIATREANESNRIATALRQRARARANARRATTPTRGAPNDDARTEARRDTRSRDRWC